MKRKIFLTGLGLILIGWMTFILGVKFAPEYTYDKVIAADSKRIGGIESTINISDHAISYLTVGKGDTILFVHGIMANKIMWYHLIFRMEKDFYIVDIDLPGFGESSRNDTADYSIEAQSERLRQIVDKLHLIRFHLAGSSMGGAIVAKYALDNPEKIKSLAFFDAAGIYSADTSDYLRMALHGDNIFIMKDKKDADRALDYLFYKPPRIARLFRIHVLIEKNNFQYHDFYQRMMDSLFTKKYSFEDKLDSICEPTIIFWGDHDRILDKSCAIVINKGIKNSELHIIKDCGHLPMLEKAAETAKIYKEFLSRHGA